MHVVLSAMLGVWLCLVVYVFFYVLAVVVCLFFAEKLGGLRGVPLRCSAVWFYFTCGCMKDTWVVVYAIRILFIKRNVQVIMETLQMVSLPRCGIGFVFLTWCGPQLLAAVRLS